MAQSSPQSAVDILFTAPHPDDLEIGMGGTIAKMVQQGYRVGMLHMTTGEPTPAGTPEIRARESASAAEVLGVQFCETLTLTNRELMDGPSARYAVASVIRRLRPRVLVGMAGRSVAASPDHYQAQLITEASRFYSQLTKWDDRFDGTAPFRIDHLIYRPLPFSAEIHHYPSRFVMDISDTMEIKLKAVACYESQFGAERLERVQHYIRSVGGAEGAQSGFQYGELYAVPRPIGTTDVLRILGDWNVPPPFQRAPARSDGLEIYIDNAPYSPATSAGTVQELIEEVKPQLGARERMIISIASNNTLVPEDQLDAVLGQPISDFERLDLCSSPIHELANGALTAASEILSKTRPVMENIVEHLASDNNAVALEALQQCIAAWGQVHTSLVQSVTLLAIDLQSIQVGDKTAPEVLNQVAYHLTQLKECLQQRDYVLLNDIVQYEILPAFDNWEAMIAAVRDRSAQGQTAASGEGPD